MIGRRNIRDAISMVLAAVSALLLVTAVSMPHNPGDTESAARRCERRVNARMALLESYLDRPGARLPDDMVIYRYVGDSLQSWRNQFSVSNDGLGPELMIPRLSNPRASMRAPLADVGEETAFYNFGPKWYLARMSQDGDVRMIIGLEVRSDLAPSFNGANPRLHINERFSILPLSSSGGTAVHLGGRPMFKLVNETMTGNSFADTTMIWLSLLFFMTAVVIFVLGSKTVRRFGISAAGIVVAIVSMYFWGLSAQQTLRIFSPSLYAGGQFLSSLGTVIIVNLGIFMLLLTLFIVRKDIASRIRRPSMIALATGLDIAAIAGVMAYTHLSLKSIILDSSIPLELYKFSDVTFYSLIVYVSYAALLMTIPMLLQLIQPVFSRLFGVHADMWSGRSRSIFALLIATYLVLSGAQLGFRKERARLEMWANRLTMERDIVLELQLRSIEGPVSNDPLISTLAFLNGSEGIIQNRIIDAYLAGPSQDYDVGVRVVKDKDASRDLPQFINYRLQNGSPIADESHFVYTEVPGGHAIYTGVFMFFNPSAGLVRMIVTIERKVNADNKGYANLLGISMSGKLSLPKEYSYARYLGASLRNFRGNFAYPTELDGRLYDLFYTARIDQMEQDGYVHFINLVSDDEAVVITRHRISVVNYLIAIVAMSMLASLLLAIPAIGRRRRMVLETNHYKTRISWVLMSSLLMTLVAMAATSVIFVTKRNEVNLSTIMSDRINAVQALVQDGLRNMHGQSDLRSAEVAAMMQTVSSNTSTDITLYDTDGRVIMSTTPDVFDRKLLGIRVDETAREQIIGKRKRYYIQKENVGSISYYSMYAPLIGRGGRIVAIICAPYTEESYDFERDAVMHSMIILTLFLILVILARLMSSAIVDRMFKPLSEMGRKMSSAGLDHLEQIEYRHNDEISTLVNSYNRMVVELSESTRKLAQAERDKAWSGMARQVAHEIKNPLTPMKLQIQRIIRLKERNAPNWEDRFDEMAKVLLDHIDILTDTANEFSTFAKLYTEEPARIDLDRLLQEEISMFDNRDDVRFDYMGLSGAEIEGPKPQLTRVFVNLIGNAVQAVESVEGGRVLVSLRNSVRDGYYDIVVEDNGPGVSEENESKLFTPNFTTKSGGSGLGLAISRSILERCGAEIRYSRSFALGGACFTITYPR